MRPALSSVAEPRYLAWGVWGALFAGVWHVLTLQTVFLWFDGPPNAAELLLNTRLLLLLGAALLVWSLLLVWRWVEPTTGAGLVLAGLALDGRVLCELVVGFFGAPLAERLPGHRIADMVGLCRNLGLVAFAFGLAATAAAVAAEGRRPPRGGTERRVRPPRG